MNEAFEEGLSLIRDAKTILIAGHVNPDGDAVGSLLALGLALQASGKTVTMALQDPVPVSCRFMPGSEQVQPPPVTGPFDLSIIVDCEGPSRTGSLEEAVLQSPKLLVIDHHLSDTRFGTVEIRDTSAAATGEILTEFLKAGDYSITEAIAECLLAAIVLDTGGLRYPNTSPRTLRMAADLRERGAEISRIYRELFENRAYPAVKLLGRALDHIERTDTGEIVYTHLTREDFAASNAGDNDTDGINLQLMSIENVEASAFFREGPAGEIRISLRSRNIVDCNAVARKFGGGGHLRASGCSLHVPLEEAIETVIGEMKRHLEAAKPTDSASEPPSS